MKELKYSQELYADIMAHAAEYFQTSETVCGAEDPAVIELLESFIRKHPELAGYSFVRVVDRYVSPWKSDTLLVFSNEGITPAEYAWYEEMMGE